VYPQESLTPTYRVACQRTNKKARTLEFTWVSGLCRTALAKRLSNKSLKCVLLLGFIFRYFQVTNKITNIQCALPLNTPGLCWTIAVPKPLKPDYRFDRQILETFLETLETSR
jgi:hypothetical protein